MRIFRFFVGLFCAWLGGDALGGNQFAAVMLYLALVNAIGTYEE